MADVIEKDLAADRQLAVDFRARCTIGGHRLLRLVAVVFRTALLAYGEWHTQSLPRITDEPTRLSQIRTRPLSPPRRCPFRPSRFPDRPIKLIVPFSPGGATDVVGRLWAERMKAKFGTVVVENKGGGGGVIGATEVARSTPNGETLLFGNTSTQVIIPAIADKPPYDPVKDFQAVYMMAISPTCIVVHESVPAKTLKEFIDYAKANPTKLSYGSAGAGTMTNLSGELFKELIGVPDITHIPYKGSAPGVTDLAVGPHPDDDAERRRAAPAIPRAPARSASWRSPRTSGSRPRPTSRPRSRRDCRAWSPRTSTACSRRPACRRTSSRRSPTRPAP